MEAHLDHLSSLNVLEPDTLKKQKKRRKKKKRPPHKSKMITGYIIYASEIRKDIIKKYPDRDFGFISKVVGLEWKNLPQATKAAYERRAQEQNIKSKAIAAQALELKKLADAAAELSAKEGSSSSNTVDTLANSTHDKNNNTNGIASSHLSYNATTNSHTNGMQQSVMQSNMQQQYLVQGRQQEPVMVRSDQSNFTANQQQQQQPFQIVQQQIQPVATTVQYCSNNIDTNGYGTNNTYSPNNSMHLQQNWDSSFSQQVQYQKNNIVYRKPTTVRLRPRDATTQTEPTVWIANEPKKPLKFSQKFLDHLNNIRHINRVRE